MSQGVMNQLGDIFNKSRSSIDGTKTTLIDDSKSFPADLLNGAMLKMKIGGIDYYRIITATTTSTLTFATLPGTAASSVWTVTVGVTITVTCATENAAHNSYTIAAALGAGNNIPLSVALVGNVLTVTLATGATGLSDDAKNTVTLVTAAIDALADFAAVAAGTGSTVVTATTAPTFTGGITAVLPVAGTPYVIGAGSGVGTTQLSGSNTIKGAVVNNVAAGTEIPIVAAGYACREAVVTAKAANTGYIYIGGSDVSSTVYGVRLSAGDSVTIPISNLNLIYFDASVSGEGISYLAVV